MLRLDLPRAPGLPIRFAKSPLWETVACARLLARGSDVPSPTALAVADMPVLAGLLGRDHPYLPDFLAPPPLEASPSFGDELAGMRQTPRAVVAGELARMHSGRGRSSGPAVLAGSGDRADHVRDAIADELQLVWERATRAVWPRLESILEGDILLRATRLAASGPGRIFADLNGLQLDTRHVTVTSTRQGRRVNVERELLLVPTVLGSPDVFAVLDSPWPVSVYYPARGAADIWDTQGETTDWLATLAGRTRARVLRALRQPATTTQIAARLRIAPASASQHLQRLRRAGLIQPTRMGTRVIYGLTGRGRRLAEL